jgi:seryl-tRNA synthetase
MIDQLCWYDNGQVALGGALLSLQRRIDRVFVDWALRRGAEEYQFPPFIAAAELAKTDYFQSFPHLATFAATLEPSDANLERFAHGEWVNGEGEVQATALAPLKNVLTPAACHHFYLHFQGADLEAPRHLTTCATCFRRESSYRPLERQWSFSMRELVCIGTEAEVAAFVADLRAEIDRFVAEIALPVQWKAATDAFFQPTQNPKWLLQRLEPNKLELVFTNGLAIASINLHRNYFGEKFRMRRAGQSAFSGCVAFGLERWLGAVLRHFGSEPVAWPAVWRS